MDRKIFFRLVTAVEQRKKILSPHEESNLRPSDILSCLKKLRISESI